MTRRSASSFVSLHLDPRLPSAVITDLTPSLKRRGATYAVDLTELSSIEVIAFN
jgi:hypothetical protein